MSPCRSVIPLESNPEIFTKFARSLGLSNGYAFHDIYSLTEPDLMAFLPRPMKAIVLLFPLNAFFDAAKDLSEDSNAGAKTGVSAGENPIWFKQTVRNACGLYALLHSLSNNPQLLENDSKLGHFLTHNKRADNRYADDQTDNFIVSISEMYNENSSLGQTEAPSAEDEVDLHFITFIESQGNVYEMDGRRPNGAKLIGKMSSGDLLEDPLVKKTAQWYMNNADEKMKMQFSLLGLAPTWD
ncbi:LAME_0A01420g1_1 [Lachancea meyersii CBS 8951]|uniref:Ubiquitin carboxyl-terminal hydrolase n=1 Tax=Lachancea meyersii CBS 8951 TaxID=1266667 RepID=A0A1G4IM83_9SACH|nr:LAME_0A01420g1_1 [Lachancea meyersii CBS 8951]